MSESIVSKYKIEIKWALIFTGMTLFWMFLEKLAGLHGEHIGEHPVYTNLIAIPATAVYVFALLDKRKNHFQGSMTYKQGFLTGILITFIVTVLSPLAQYVTSTVITPEYFPNVIEYAVREGKLSLEEAQDYFNLKSYIIQGLIGAPIMGLLTTAIVAIFTRRSGE